MDSTELRNLHEAYLDVYEQDEILGEAEVMKHQKERSAIERRKKMKGYEPPTKGVHGEIERRQAQKPPSKLRSGSLPESYDLFDTILEHLVSEGYADTNESALVIMANMSEEWRQSIVAEASVTDDRVRRNQKAFGSNYTPPRDWDQSANRGKGAVLNAKQKEKQRRKGLVRSAE